MIKNAKISSTKLGRNHLGIMTFMIYIECNNYFTGIGGYALDTYDKGTEKRVFSAKGIEAISKILYVVGVENWEDLKNKQIRIIDNGWGTTIDEIGNISEDKWFNLREFFTSES